MTAWSTKTKPTPANIRKRINAALDALDGARALAEKHPSLGKKLATPIKNAEAWARDAAARTR